ncbi:MAG: aminotransferase class V-fold PLP-dependent enzyme [Acidobacteria bacterium]|nr:MAG: aminotransferase class V-fold PLP-dependent enzyme [Acidobacteriota bacterium]
MSERDLFDVPDEVAYFNCAYYSPLLNESRRRLMESAAAKSHPWERTTASFFDDAETIRALASQLFGGDADGYAVMPAVSYGISTAARAVRSELAPGDRILVIAEEFPSNVLPWRRAAEATGAQIVTVPTPADGDWTRATLPMIDARTKVIAMSTCHWTNGAHIDLAPIAAAGRAHRSILVVDATQSLGAMPFAMAEIRPDFLVAAAYKWLLSPYGVALMYVSDRWRDAQPLEESWLARDNAYDFTALAEYSDTYLPGARRFDGGEKATASLPGAIAALEQIQAWGIERIARTLAGVNARIGARLAQLGFTLPPERLRCPHMFGAVVPAGAVTPAALVTELRSRKIYISQRGQSLRFAPHMHINDQDVEHLLDALTTLVA